MIEGAKLTLDFLWEAGSGQSKIGPKIAAKKAPEAYRDMYLYSGPDTSRSPSPTPADDPEGPVFDVKQFFCI